MNQSPDKLSGTQNQAVAKLHVECLPHTAVSHLGERYAARFYDYVALSPTEHAFIRKRLANPVSQWDRGLVAG